ncbi:PilZ domain-containing protein [Sphingomicrobium sp. XHP0235]|uniref:PilZ domain-containing protein n=1 Tax=Sphingomicrobium aquimarinum TaxID=3133971 RepID=UPI0031FE53C2
MTDRMMETTLYSLDDAAPSPDRADRREDERHLTLYRVGSIELDDRRELCLIKNISAGGMMIRAYCELQVGDALRVELKNGEPIEGRATWIKGQNVGVAFEKPIDILDILSTSLSGPRPRMPRIEVACPVTVFIDSQPTQAMAVDVSQGGVKLAITERLPRNDKDIGIGLPGLAPIRASVRWQDEEYAGITFNRLLPLGDLVAWLEKCRAPSRKAS